jgi:hypothetical protein
LITLRPVIMSSRDLSTGLLLAQPNQLVYSRDQLLALRVDLIPSTALSGQHSLFGARQPVGPKCAVNEQVRQLINELGCRRATRGRRAGSHNQANRRRHQLIVSSFVVHANKPGEIPTITGNRHVNKHPDKQKLTIDPNATRRSILVQVDSFTDRKLNFEERSELPTIYAFNAASIAKPHAIEQLTADLIGYSVDVAIISESHLKLKHTDSAVNIDGYILFRRDRRGRREGGVAVYVKRNISATEWPVPGMDTVFELLWIKTVYGNMVIFVGAIYHPPAPIYNPDDLLDHIETAVFQITRDFPFAKIILAGDVNMLPDCEITARSGMISIVNQPTRGNSNLDRIYTTDMQYCKVKVIQSAVKSDHKAIIAYSDETKTIVVNKSHRRCRAYS